MKSRDYGGWWIAGLLALFALIALVGLCRGQDCSRGQCAVPGLQTPTYQPYRPAPVKPQQPAEPAVVRVSDYRTGEVFHATGVIWDSEPGRIAWVLTANHTFRGGPCDVIVTTWDGRRFRAGVLGQDDNLDLAVLAIADPGIAPCPIADADPAIGESVVGYGWGAGQFAAFPGQVLAGNSGNPWLYVSGGQRDGDSGAPVLNAKRQVVCCVWGSRDGKRYGCRPGPILEFLRRVLCPPSKPKPPTPPAMPATPPTSPTIMVPVPGPVGLAGPKGDKGERGEPGPAGPAGRDGKDGKDADCTALRAEIAKLRADMEALRNLPIGIRTLNLDGSTHQEAQARLGDLVILKPLAVKTEAK